MDHRAGGRSGARYEDLVITRTERLALLFRESSKCERLQSTSLTV